MAARVLVLGGYGEIGLVLCERLLEETGVAVVLAGRRLAAAQAAVARLAERFGDRASAAEIDVTKAQTIEVAAAGCTWIVNLTPATEATETIAPRGAGSRGRLPRHQPAAPPRPPR